jgi:outer membrane protein assembly factor BamB
MRRIPNPSRRSLSICVLLVGFLLSASPAFADCDDTYYPVQVWYTAGGSEPVAGDECSFALQKLYRVGQCTDFAIPPCQTDHCGWGNWRGSFREKALNEAINQDLGYTCEVPLSSDESHGDCVEQARTCGEALTLWGAISTGGTTQFKWSLAPEPFTPTFEQPVAGNDGTVYWGDRVPDGVVARLSAFYREGQFLPKHPGERSAPYLPNQTFLDAFFQGPDPSTRGAQAVGPDGTVYQLWDRLWAFDASLPQLPKWTYPASAAERLEGVASAPAVAADGTIFFATSAGMLYAIRADGSLRWELDVGGNLTGVSLGGDSTLYVGSRDGPLYAIDKTGALLWYYDPTSPSPPISGYQNTGRWIEPPAIAADGTLYISVNFRWQYCIGLCIGLIETGQVISLTPRDHVLPRGAEERWVYTLEGGVREIPVVATLRDAGTGNETRWVAFSGDDKKIYGIRDVDFPDTSEPVGQRLSFVRSHEFSDLVAGSPVIAEDGTIFTTNQNGSLYALQPIKLWDGETNPTQWSLGMGGTPTGPVLDGEPGSGDAALYVGVTVATDGNALHAIYAGAAPAADDWPMARRGADNAAQAYRGIAGSPLSSDLGEVERGEASAPRAFRIANNGDDLLAVNIDVTGDTTDFVVDLAAGGESGCGESMVLLPGQACTGEVTFKPQSLGVKELKLQIESDDPVLGILTLRMSGESNAPAISVVASTDFGTVPPDPSVQQVAIENEGTSNLVITGVTFSNASFELANAPSPPTFPLTVAPEETTSLGIAFAAGLVPGLATATLNIASNDPRKPVERVLLYGVSDSQSVSSLIGFVRDGETGFALGGAVVQAGGLAPVLSSSDNGDLGFFRIDVEDIPQDFSLSVKKSGYIDSTQDVSLGASPAVEEIAIGLISECGAEPRIQGISLESDPTVIDPLEPICIPGGICILCIPGGICIPVGQDVGIPGGPEVEIPGGTFDSDVTFVSGISHGVTVTAAVDWCGTLPSGGGQVRFYGPGIEEQIVETSGSTASIGLDMGELSGCSKLFVQAVAGDASSIGKRAPFKVMPRILPDLHPSLFNYTPFGNSFRYEAQEGINFPIFDFVGDKGVPRDSQPLSGLRSVMKYLPKVSETYKSDGSYRVKLAFEGLARCVGSASSSDDPKKKQVTLDRCLSDQDATAEQFDAPKYDLGKGLKGAPSGRNTAKGISFTPVLKFEGEFNETRCENSVGGKVGIVGTGSFESTTYFAPYPSYGKLGVAVSLDASFGVVGFGGANGVELDGGLLLTPTLKATVGAGISDILAAEAWASGAITLDLVRPKDVCEITARGGITFYAILYTWGETIAVWTYDCSSGRSLNRFAVNPSASGPSKPTLIGRDYALADNYATFHGGRRRPRTKSFDATGSSKDLAVEVVESPTDLRLIQENVFPRSETAISAAGDHVYLTWLYDDLSRADDNRTVAVFATWDGDAWTPGCGDGNELCAVSDDGTADFHPQLLTLPNGSAHVAWENLGAPPASPVELEDMLGSLEICTSLFDPTAAPPFSDQICLTDNAHLDRSPALAGVSADDVLLTWVSNSQNDMEGGSEAPNMLWSSRYSGGAWSEPQSVAELAYPLSQYSLAYDGTDGYLVASLDADQGSLVCTTDGQTRCELDEDCADLGGTCELGTTVIDRDLFLMHYNAGTDTWGNPYGPEAAARLTDDDLADDSPLVTLDPTGKFLLVWLQADQLVGVSDLAAFGANPDPESIETIWRDKASGYTNNLSSFEFAKNGDQLALVWAQPVDDGYSDLVASLYDPRLEMWSPPRTLNDPDLDLETYIAPTFDFKDYTPRLLTVYNRTEIQSTENALNDPNALPDLEALRGETDLVMQLYPLRDDPALYEYSLIADPFDPKAGAAVTLTVDVLNDGDRGLDRAVVRFHTDEAEIGTVEVPGAGGDPLLPGESIPAIDDRDLNNNQSALSLLAPDLTVQAVSRKHLAGAVYEVSASIANIGSASVSGPIQVNIREQAEDGALLDEQTVEPLAPGANAEVKFLYEYGAAPEAGSADIYFIADEPNDHPESDETNNTGKLVVPQPDTVIPTITAPESVVVEATGPEGASVEVGVSALDGTGEVIPVSCAPALGSVFPLGNTQVTCTATDLAGNTVSATIMVSVVDTTPPVLSAFPEDFAVECDGAPDAPPVSATDLYDGSVEVVFDATRTNGECANTYTLTRTWSAVDSSGNAVEHSQSIDVVDTTAPVLLGTPADATAECSAVPAPATVTAADNCSAEVAVDFAETRIDGANPDEYTLERIWSATDACGNPAQELQILSVVDTAPPALICPSVAPAECSSPSGAPVSLVASAVDACSATVRIENDRSSNGPDASDTYPLGTTSVSFTATDAAGNQASCATPVTVKDETPPTLVLTADPATLWPPNGKLVPVQLNSQALDICDPNLTVSLVSATSNEPDDASGPGDGSTTGDISAAEFLTPDGEAMIRAERDGTGTGRIYELIYSAADASGNATPASAIVTVPHDEGL